MGLARGDVRQVLPCVQAMAVHSAIINGMKQMDEMPLKDSLMLARMMDTVVKENTPPNKK